jgi:hypothetical protein
MSETTGASSASLTTRADAGEGKAGVVSLWLQAIDLAGGGEFKEWRERVGKVLALYRGEVKGLRAPKRFNMLYANTETLAPAVYNSTPIPDVRRRFSEADPVGKAAGTIIERALTYSMEECEFDAMMRRAVKDALLAGRATARVRYVPTFDDGPEPENGATADEPESGAVVDERTTMETVPWNMFRHGPASVWSEVPWVAFCHYMTRAELIKLSPKLGMRVNLDARVPGMDESKDTDGQPPPDLFRRATVWEVWDKEKRRVLFVAKAWPDAPLAEMDDPLGLKDFFPCPRPIIALETPDSLVPVEPYRLYKDLADELDIITRRITALTSALKWRGAYVDPQIGDFLAKFQDLKDGEMTPLDNPGQMLNGGGGLEKAFWFMPIEQCAAVLAQLYTSREQIKQTIYEVTGIADIVRGATSPSETATAQSLKSQWGNLRIQALQAEVGRFARDGLRLMGEVMAEKFDGKTLFAISGMKLPSNAEVMQQVQQQMQQAQQPPAPQGPPQPGQPPAPPPGPPPPMSPADIQAMQARLAEAATQENVLALLQDDAMRRFRIDIETDSTIRADVSRAQENVGQFVQGFGAFIASVGPAVQQGALPMSVASEMVKSFARAFKLGRAVEDALEEMPKQQPPQADPAAAAAKTEEAKAQAALQVEQVRQQGAQASQSAEMQVRAAEAQAAQQLEQQKLAADAQTAQLQAEVAIETKRMELATQERIAAAKLQAEQQRNAADADEREAAPVRLQSMQAHVEQITAMLAEAAKHAAAPAELVRGPDGRAAAIRRNGVERQILRGPDGRATGVQ